MLKPLLYDDGGFEGFFMERLSPRFGDTPGRQINQMYTAFSVFRYENGYALSAVDLGAQGVKIELNRTFDIGGAIILPPKKIQEFGRWLLQSLGQDSFGLPKDLSDVLARIVNHKKSGQIFERGDKKKIRDALKILRREQMKLKSEEKVLRLISANAI